MITPEIKKQLEQHFSPLSVAIQLQLFDSQHPKAKELEEMAEAVASCNKHITVIYTDQVSAAPRLEVMRNNEPTGITFLGVPGGHEFTSFILAILNSSGLGKLPDQGLQQRVANLNVQEEFTTVVSLSCENCPEIVQALNQMALFHPGLKHVMFDGDIDPDLASKLNVSSVPAVFAGQELIHTGRGSFAQLLEKLENKYGYKNSEQPVIKHKRYDVAIVGGGPAGASAAIYTARKGLSTVIIADKIGGQVQETKGIENLISVIYTEGPKLAESLSKHIRSYDIDLLENRRVQKIDSGETKILHLGSGEIVEADNLVMATGAQWRKLGVPGEVDYLGQGVAYCPHCDGPFYKNKKVAVVGGGNSGVEAAIDLAGICEAVTLIEFAPELKADQVLQDKLRNLKNVTVVTNAATDSISGNGSKVTAIHYRDRSTEEKFEVLLDGVFVQIGLRPNSELVKDLVELNPFGEIVIDEKCRTSEKGVYAAGDVTVTPFKQIVVSLGEGAKAGLALFEDRVHQAVGVS